ncbi:DUF169 domain-containing protein [bacterium]|nr:DUF169 domain-containing protein [bacterium]RQV92042.1 MAG: hypothetical protein EH221_12200 [bacterium]
MEKNQEELFIERWRTYFSKEELPIVFFYADQVSARDVKDSKNEHRCLICNLNRVRAGYPFVYHSESPGCPGGKRYTGFSQDLRPDFEYFLSCGIPGEMGGERYKQSPELVRELLKRCPPIQAPGKFLVFKRWDQLSVNESPIAVLFFASADVLSGLFTLANYDIADRHGVIAPMGSGCSSIVYHPLEESQSDHPRCVLGLFDVSARPCVEKDKLTFAVPMNRFVDMVNNMDESFLITESWRAVKKRMDTIKLNRSKIPQ